MKMNFKKNGMLIACLVLPLTYVSCKSAAFEVISGKNNKKQEQPQNFGNGNDRTDANPDSNNGAQAEDEFKMSANPTTTNPGTKITFTGKCGFDGKGTVTWQYGDGAASKGATTQYSYNRVGTYVVNGICVTAGGKTIKKTITIAIIPKKPGFPGQNPGQKPGQFDAFKRR
jgi:hypothetical protein